MLSPVKKKRKKMRLTQIRMANMAGVTQTYISELENGDKDIDTRLVAFFRKYGHDTEVLQRQHQKFMQEIARKERKRIVAAAK